LSNFIYFKNGNKKGIEESWIPKEICKIYLIPVFLRKGQKFRLKEKEIRFLARGCLYYEIDAETQGHPSKYRRVLLLTTDNLNVGFRARKRILKGNNKKKKVDRSSY